jgi:predicted metal-dependent HD superfamily phosphohydrolase
MKTELLFNQWEEITNRYQPDRALQLSIFNSLVKNYSETGRYYHNLRHIENMLTDLGDCYGKKIPDPLFFAAWFHDAIYNTVLGNNEAKSAALAQKKLAQLNVPIQILTEVESLILKTANHLDAEADDETTRLFLDIDLKILGADESAYRIYTQVIRKEYGMYPDLLFNQGRKKFIGKALNAKRIFKTGQFFNAFEQQARKNLITELNQLL